MSLIIGSVSSGLRVLSILGGAAGGAAFEATGVNVGGTV